MKRIFGFLILFFIFNFGFSQEDVNPIKEPSLVTAKEYPSDTFALVNINRLRNINEKLVYMYELMCVKDSLYSVIDSYSDLVKTKNEIIKVQQIRIDKLDNLYQQAQVLLTEGDKIIIQQKNKIKTKNKIVTALGISTGAAVGLLLLSIIVH